MNDLKILIKRFQMDLKDIYVGRPRVVCLIAGSVFLLLIYGLSKASERSRKVLRLERDVQFKGQRILGDVSTSVYEAKERSFLKIAGELLILQKKLADDLKSLTGKVETMAIKPEVGSKAMASENAAGQPSSQTEPQGAKGTTEGVVPNPPSEGYNSSKVNPEGAGGPSYSSPLGITPTQKRTSRGASVISFPVKDDGVKEELGVVLPPGSYVKAKLLTGVEAPEGRPYPVLVQLDYANVLPNRHKLDLSGCFMIIKAQGDLSTERVQMQATKLSCVGKFGQMFEKEVNGFVVDDQDNSFAVSGEVNSKQDRVAATAFLSSIVEGVSKAIQMAQTTQQTTPGGGSQSMLTGDEKKYIVAGGASNAAGVVTQWYLKQAENLLPTIKVGSGRDVWVVIQDSINLPKTYFKKGIGNESRYEYVTRIID